MRKIDEEFLNAASSARSDTVEYVRVLLEQGADINCQTEKDTLRNNSLSEGVTALILAAKTNQPDLVALLLTNGANAELTDNAGRQAIHYAAIHDDAMVIKELVAHGCDVNSLDNESRTPLHISLSRLLSNVMPGFSIDAPVFLLKNGADVTNQSKNGVTAMDIVQEWMANTSKCPDELMVLMKTKYEDSVLTDMIDSSEQQNSLDF